MANCNKEPQGFFARWRKRRSLRKQVRTIGTDLVRKHGKNKSYSTKDIKSAWEDRGYSDDYMCYAMAAYSSPSDFQEYHFQIGEACDYQAMRGEVKDVCFQGAEGFSNLDVGGADSSSWFSDSSSGGDSDTSVDGGDFGSGD